MSGQGRYRNLWEYYYKVSEVSHNAVNLQPEFLYGVGLVPVTEKFRLGGVNLNTNPLSNEELFLRNSTVEPGAGTPYENDRQVHMGADMQQRRRAQP